MIYSFFANCVPVVGYSRVAIIDFQRDSSVLLPLEFFNIIIQKDTKIVNNLINEIVNSKKRIEYENLLNYLINNEIIFECKSEANFPKLSLDYFNFVEIDNCIIDLNIVPDPSKFDYLVYQLIQLQCLHLQLRIFFTIDFFDLTLILNILKKYEFNSVELILPFNESFSESCISSLVSEFYFLYSIVFFNSSTNKVIPSDRYDNGGNLIFTTENLNSHIHCGQISPKLFIQNIQTFTESQKYNTCLNRKISIDVDGNIKNCPSMKKSYGNISSTTLREVLEMEGFKDLWYIHKDQIEVCKDCEFRHICTDCRAYIQDPNNKYSKPAKCSYNPYTATWGDENPTNNPLYGQ